MNKKTLKLFLAAALGLSLLCAAQTVNAMEKNTNLNKNLTTNSENKSIIEKISSLDDDVKGILEDMEVMFPKYQGIVTNKLKFYDFIDLFFNAFKSHFLVALSSDDYSSISINISKNISKSSDGKRLLFEDVISEDNYEKFCGLFALKCVKDFKEKFQPQLPSKNEQIKKCLNELRSELEKNSDQNKNRPLYLKTILDRLLDKSLLEYRPKEEDGQSSEENLENLENLDSSDSSENPKHSSLYDLFSSSVDKMNIKLPNKNDKKALTEKREELTDNLDRTYRKLVDNQDRYDSWKNHAFYEFINYFIIYIRQDFSSSFNELEYYDLFDDEFDKIEHFTLNLVLEKIGYKNFHKTLGEVWSEYKIYEEKINELYKEIMEKAIEIFDDKKVDDSALIKNEMQLELFHIYRNSLDDIIYGIEGDEKYISYDALTTNFENNIKLDYGEDDFPLDAKYSKYIAKFKESLNEFFKVNPNFKTSSKTEKEKFKEKLSEQFSEIKENFDKI